MKIERPIHPLLPDAKGFFGAYGGAFVPEILRPNLLELDRAFSEIVQTDAFWHEFTAELKSFSGRPTPVTEAKNLSKHLGGARIFLKREDLGQTGAHKINNVIGQGLLAKKLGKTRLIAETGAGQHGIATATIAARLGLKACIYMGAEDVDRQRPNVFWMERLGAEVVPVTSGAQTLKDAINEALRDWSSNLNTTHYLLGTVCGPHPFPALVAYLQALVGLEARQQILELAGRLPDRVYACVGGGSNALGIFQGFLQDTKTTTLVGVEAGGRGNERSEHARRFGVADAHDGIAQGYKSIFLQDADGQMLDTYSIAAGLDYVGVSPIIADLVDKKKMQIDLCSDEQAITGMQLLMAHEGIIPALESSHGIGRALIDAKSAKSDQTYLINVSGRGDKDIFTVAEVFHDERWGEFLQRRSDRLSGRGKVSVGAKSH